MQDLYRIRYTTKTAMPSPGPPHSMLANAKPLLTWRAERPPAGMPEAFLEVTLRSIEPSFLLLLIWQKISEISLSTKQQHEAVLVLQLIYGTRLRDTRLQRQSHGASARVLLVEHHVSELAREGQVFDRGP